MLTPDRPFPHCRPVRAAPLGAALAAAVAALVATAWAAPSGDAPARAAAASPWRRSIAGMYGDNPASVLFIGDTRRGGFRFYALFNLDFGLWRAGSEVEAWQPIVPNAARPDTTVVRSAALGRDDIERQKVYAGLQSRPLLARSLDGGATWTTRDGPPGITRIDLLDTTTTGRIYAAQANTAALSTSDDGGDTWTQVAPVIGAQDLLTNLFAAPDRPQVFLQSGDRLYTTDNIPDAWRLALGPASATTTTLAVELAAAAVGRRVVAVGKTGGAWAMVYSLDGGTIWTPASWPAEPNAEPSALGAGEAGFGVPAVWLGFADGRVFRSTDLGQTWHLVTTVPIAPISISVDPHNYEAWVGTDGFGLVRIGSGASPLITATGAVPAQALAVTAPNWEAERRALVLARITPARLARVGGGQPTLSVLFDSTDEGRTWVRRFVTPTFGTALHASTNYARDKRIYSDRYFTRNGGQSWSDLGTPPGGGAAHVMAVGPVSGTYSLLMAIRQPWNGTSGGSGLLYSDTGGATWQDLDASTADIVDAVFSPAFPSDLTAFFITQRGVVYRTLDGHTFESISTVRLLAGQGIVHDLAISPRFDVDRTLFVAVEDTADSQRAKVFVSSNGGTSWEDRFDGLAPRGRPRAIGLSPNFRADRTVFLGFGREPGDADDVPTIYGSDTGGTEWLGQLSLGRVATTGFAFAGAAPAGRLFAASGRSGVWVRDLDGAPIVDLIPTPTVPATATPSPTLTPTDTPAPGGGTPGGLETQCLDAEADAYVSQNTPEGNFGVGQEIQLYHDGAERTAIYLKFALDAIPIGSQLQSATIELYLRALSPSTTPPHSQISTVSRGWFENRITWANRPPTGNDIDAPVLDVALGYKAWDVLPIVDDWVQGRGRNDGLVIEPTNTLPTQPLRAKFASREHVTASQRPRLCVTYRPPSGGASPTPTRTRTAGPTATAGASATATAEGTPSPTIPPPTATASATPDATPDAPSPTATATAATATATTTATAEPTSVSPPGAIYLPFGFRFARATPRPRRFEAPRPAAGGGWR